MKKFEKILRKHIEAARAQPNLDVSSTNTSPCYIGSNGVIDVAAICEAVEILSREVGNPMSNECAKKIKSSNTKACSTKKYTKAGIIISKCNNYASSVVAALPQNATQEQRAEAERKAKCDCLNLAVFGRPSSILSSVGFEAGVMKNQIIEFFLDGCTYPWISNVCAEMSKVRDAILAINPICKLPT